MSDIDMLAELRARREACEGERAAAIRSGATDEPAGSTPGVTGAHKRDGIDGASELLADVRALIETYVVLPGPDAAVALSLFVLHTWSIEAAHATPYLVVVSPEKQSGKTRLLEVLELAVCKPWKVTSPSEAVLYRSIDANTPTLLMDEIDAIFGSNSERTEPLRALLNASNRRGVGIPRCVGPKSEVVNFNVFCPKVLAGIDTGKLPETITDRAVTLHMKRQARGEKAKRLRFRFAERDTQELRDRLQAWAQTVTDGLQGAVPDLPEELSDRAADAWEPLFAIADIAGDEWAVDARSAAVTLSGVDEDDVAGRGAQLLAAIRKALATDETITTVSVLMAINEDEELPFGGWREGKGIDGRTLARHLKPYGVKPKTIRTGQETAKGYHRLDLQDAFARYLPEASQPSQPSQDDRVLPGDSHSRADVTAVTDVTATADTDPAAAIKALSTIQDPAEAEREWNLLQAVAAANDDALADAVVADLDGGAA